MTRKRKSKKIRPFPKFEQVQPFDPDEFNTALSWYQNAAIKTAHVSNPAEYGLHLDLGEGTVEHIGFTDIPLNRGIIALKERYGDDSDKFFSITTRIWALFHIMHDEKLSKYMRGGDSYTEVHQAVIDAAATVMLDEHGNFPVDAFLSRVEELNHTKYKDDKSID